jgi:hypothetical protein
MRRVNRKTKKIIMSESMKLFANIEECKNSYTKKIGKSPTEVLACGKMYRLYKTLTDINNQICGMDLKEGFGFEDGYIKLQ